MKSYQIYSLAGKQDFFFAKIAKKSKGNQEERRWKEALANLLTKKFFHPIFFKVLSELEYKHLKLV